MAKRALAADRHQLWVFGQSMDFHVVTSTIALAGGNFLAAGHQKTQIVLHGTAGHGSAEGTITDWNTGGAGGGPKQASASFVVERTFTPQTARPGGGTGELQDTGLVDVVRVIGEDQTAFHAGNPNDHPNLGLNFSSFGIEIANLSEALWNLLPRDEPDGIAGFHTPLATCPATINVGDAAHPHHVCNHGRALDLNRWIRLPMVFEGMTDLQALDDEQNMALILLLRHLCIRHRIPRQFFGNSRDEIFRHWFYDSHASASELRVRRSKLSHFRGILVHRNVHASKICPGLVNRNFLYRGISDEWWLPVQPDGVLRQYYSGPFKKPPFVANQPTRNYCFRYTAAGRIEGVVFRDADLDALLETRSYYDTDQTESYYGLVENWLGGTFPMGTNKVWHGGVHFEVKRQNPCVFAAASGTIVAARVSSNADTEADPRFGSQRFVLLKHAVHRELQWDHHGLGQQIDYDAAPKRIFSLYMHLAPVEDPAHEHDRNPPWFNIWRRANPDADVGMDGEKGRVFAPDSQVCVGDILGLAANFRGRNMIHFEIISHKDVELKDAPWDDEDQIAKDEDQDLICDVAKLEQFLTARLGLPLKQISPVAAAKELRKSKAFHKSEWALTAEDQITTLIRHPDRRKVIWPHIRRFSWVAEAIAANPSLKDQLGDGMFWHYHPITFMQHMNELALHENRVLQESKFHQTNVQLSDDYFLTNFERFDAHMNAYVPTNVDRAKIRIADYSNGNFEYDFTRADIACMQPGDHAPEMTPPQSTRFSLALFETLEQIHQHLGKTFRIALSHVCDAHAVDPGLCVMNNADAIGKHKDGIAADIRPGAQTAAECRSLWNSVVAIVTPLNSKYAQYCGAASQGDLPGGYEGIRYTTTDGPLAALSANPQQNIAAGDVADFRIHLELIAAGTPPQPVRTVKLKITFLSASVLDDDRFDGDWEIQAVVNGKRVNSTSGDGADKGDVIKMDWSENVDVPENGHYQLLVGGKPGQVSHTYGPHANPPWAAGQWSENSSQGAFRLTWRVEWLNESDFGS
jgi:hypothetical protein